MNRKTILMLVAVGIAFAMGFSIAAYMTNPAGGVIPRNAVAGGGGTSTAGGGQLLNSTIGQPATGISTAGNGTVLVGGFQTMVPPGRSSARHWELY